MSGTDTQTIYVSDGAVEYTWPVTITETTGKDISAVGVELSLGTYTAPGTWQAPDTDPPQATKSQRVVQLLVGGTLKPAPGRYYLWTRSADTPEIVEHRVDTSPITIV